MRNALIITFLLALGASLSAQNPGIHPSVDAAAEAEIKTLELKFAELIVRGDWDEYVKHLAPDYLHTRDNGQRHDKLWRVSVLRVVVSFLFRIPTQKPISDEERIGKPGKQEG